MVYVFLADGFEEIEAISILDVLRRANIPVSSVGISKRLVSGAHEIQVAADLLIDDIADGIDTDEITMLVLPGGLDGVDNMAKCQKLCDLLTLAYKKQKPIAAICAAPTLLCRLGMLQDKDATCYFGMQLPGANAQDKNVVTCGHIITGRSAMSAIDFSLELVRFISGSVPEIIR